jgi:hypothetical protein
VFVGWGQSAYYSEFAPAGNLFYKATIPGSNYSYRAYRETWVGMPTYPPAIGLLPGPGRGQTTVYASWNGATEVKTWEVFSGPHPTTLVGTQAAPKSGFETAIISSSPGPYFQVKGLDAHGTVLGASGVFRLW